MKPVSTSAVLSVAQMSWPEVKAALPMVELAVLPTGSTEQHGPALALITDTAIAAGLAQRVAARIYPRALLLPPLPVGVSPHHMSFPGTLTLTADTFQNLVFEVVESLQAHGLKQVLIVNGHGGNQASLNIVAARVRHTLKMKIAIMFWLDLVDDVIRQHVTSEQYGHACEVETSLAWFLNPELVQPQLLAVGQMTAYAAKYTDRRLRSDFGIPFRWEELTSNGAFGDGRKASVEFGAILCGAIVERTVAFLEDFLREKTQAPSAFLS
jgi:creatinine amidohydrolase